MSCPNNYVDITILEINLIHFIYQHIEPLFIVVDRLGYMLVHAMYTGCTHGYNATASIIRPKYIFGERKRKTSIRYVTNGDIIKNIGLNKKRNL